MLLNSLRRKAFLFREKFLCGGKLALVTPLMIVSAKHVLIKLPIVTTKLFEYAFGGREV